MPEIDPQLQFAPAAPLPHPTVKQAEEAGAIGGGCTIGSLLRRDIPLAIVTSSQVPYRDLLQSLELGYAMTMQVISVVGALMVLFAYGLIQAGTWRELDAGYLALNIVGSLLLGIVALEDRRVGFVLLEFAWAGIAMVGVARAVRARRGL
jgi:hypothetical protein